MAETMNGTDAGIPQHPTPADRFLQGIRATIDEFYSEMRSHRTRAIARAQWIQPLHQTRLAIVYVRSATVPQTDHDVARLEYQRAQRVHAYEWGWAPETVQVIEDIGQGGHTAARLGFQRLRDMIAARQVGLVLVSDPSRLARSAVDFGVLTDLCRQTDTLIAGDGRLRNFGR